jgi:hypothetical protein
MFLRVHFAASQILPDALHLIRFLHLEFIDIALARRALHFRDCARSIPLRPIADGGLQQPFCRFKVCLVAATSCRSFRRDPNS